MQSRLVRPQGGALAYCSLGSGSKGNATLIQYDDTILMIDCGFSVKETTKRLEHKGLKPEQISAILVTHEHADHIAGVARLSNRYSIPVWLSKGTSFHKSCDKIEQLNVFNSHSPFDIGPINIQPVPVPHDAREAIQFIFIADKYKLGLLTDLGVITPHILTCYKNCQSLLLEFNYDSQMLSQGRYPYGLKQRVAGDLGHLSNQQSIDFLKQIDRDVLKHLVIMHISQENNRQDIVSELVQSELNFDQVKVEYAEQNNGFDWWLVN